MPIENRYRIGTTARWAVAAAVLATAIPLTANAAALRVVQDPVTGELRGPTATEAEAFAKAEAALRASTRSTPAARSTGPKEIHYADGTVETKLDEDSMMFAVVNQQTDGSLRMDCLPAAEAKTALKATNAKKTSKQHVAKVGHDHP